MSNEIITILHNSDQEPAKPMASSNLKADYLSDSDGVTFIDGDEPSFGSGSETETEDRIPRVSRKHRRKSIASECSNTGAQKGLTFGDLDYLRDANEEEDWSAYFNMSETFLRNHHASVVPPERWISIQEFLDAEAASGNTTD